MKHLQSGSYDFESLKLSLEVMSDLMPGQKFLVIECMSAPSQKGLGSVGKLYSLRLAFLIGEDGECTLMTAPYTMCECPVGVGACAHKGGAVSCSTLFANVSPVMNMKMW